MMGYGWGFGGLGMALMLLFWVLVVLLAVWLLSRLFPGASSGPGAQTPRDSGATTSNALDILNQRYARGEISRAEYEEMRSVLRP